MKITSPAFEHEGDIPKKYTCQGDDVCPPLEIADIPEGTQSLALIVHDHDAPGGDFAHWLIWNIDPSVSKIEEGTTPVGSAEGTNDFGKIGYGGPCPPSGKHRYEFHLYALRSIINLPEKSNKTDLRGELTGKVIEEASLVGLYEKV